MSCAGTYKPLESGVGYLDHQIDQKTFEVKFRGNEHHTQAEVNTFLTYRCAEITLEQGFTHFLIEEDLSSKNVEEQVKASDLSYRTSRAPMTGVNVTVTDNFNAQSTHPNIERIYLISMRQGPDPVHIAASIDAKKFMESKEHLIKR